MGKGKDIYSHVKRLDDDFPYEPVGISRLLSCFHMLEERTCLGGDYDTAVILRDLKDALDSDILTPRMRQTLALYYFADLEMDRAADILGVKQQTVSEYHLKAVERIAAYMASGGNVRYRREKTMKRFDSKRPLYQWLNDVAGGSVPVYVVPDEVHSDIIDWLANIGDERAQEVARQRRHGAPEVKYEYKDARDEYPCLHPRQMQYRESKQIPVPEVYPKFDVAGRRKTHAMNDGEMVQKVKPIFVFPR